MKVRIYSYMALMVLALGFGACTEECDYLPAGVIDGNCIKASFSTDGEYLILPAEAENKVTITAEREKTDVESTIALRATSVNDIHFQIPQSMAFASGKATTTFDVTFSDIELEEEYKYSVAMDESAYDPYNANTLATTSGTILKKAHWDSSLGQGSFSLSGLGANVPCEIQKTSDAEKWFKAVAPLEDGNDLVFKVNEDNTVRFRKQPVCMVNVGLPEPVMLYVSLNPKYGGVYDPEQNTIIVVLDYTCEAGSLGTFEDILALPAN